MSKNLLNLLLFVASGALYYLVISPLYKGGGTLWSPEQTVQSQKALLDQYSGTIGNAEKVASEASNLYKQYQSVDEETKNRIKYIVPDSIDPIRLRSEVIGIAANKGFAVVSPTFTQDLQKKRYIIKFSVSTTYFRIKELLAEYENSLRLYSIRKVTFSTPKADANGLKKDDTELINFVIEMETYYMK